MPIDQKRINGPETSIPYDIYVHSEEKDEIQIDASKRHDGRSNNELRDICLFFVPALLNWYNKLEREKIYLSRSNLLHQFSSVRTENRPLVFREENAYEIFSAVLRTGIVSQAKGSAYIEMGNTKVICSVFDPREVPNKVGYCVQGELYCEFKFAPFSHRKRKMHQQDAEEKEYSLVLQRALEPAVCLNEFPNFQVDIYATVLDNGGSALAAAIMAASLALANAGVPMYGLVTASTIGVCDDIYLVDPTDTEESSCSSRSVPGKGDHGIIVQAALPQHSQIAEMFVVGSFDTDTIVHSMSLLSTAHKDICPLLEQCLVKTIFKSFHPTKKECEK